MPRRRRTPRVLTPDVYDTLELSAFVYDGIGRFSMTTVGEEANKPCCIYGHALWASALTNFAASKVADELMFAVTPADSDRAVGKNERISFATWCRRLNVVRGNAAPADGG